MWTSFKSVGRGNFVNVHGGFPSYLALQSLVGLRLQWADGCDLSRVLGFKNYKTYLNRRLVQEAQ